MSTSSRRDASKATYHHGDLRNALLASARELLAEAGIDGFGLREVSRRTGVSHTAAYNHFENRAALVRALVLEAFAGLEAALRRAQDAAVVARRSPLERLQDVGVAYVLFAFEHPADFRFMFRPEFCTSIDDPRGDGLRKTASGSYAPLVESIAACVTSGALTGDPEILALTAWSGVHGLASLVLDGPFRDEVTDLATVTTLARGVARSLFGAAESPGTAETSRLRSDAEHAGPA